MASTTGTRPSHYQVLGLKPGASAGEIEAAFARELRRPRAFGGLAEVGIAYETLKDPAKRRAYDEAIGVAPKPAPAPAQTYGAWQFIASAKVHPVGPAEPAILARPAAPLTAPVRPEPQATPAPAPSVIGSSLRELADPAPLAQRISEPQPQVVEPAIDERLLDDAEDGAIEWRGPVLAGGALVLAAGLLGAWAGLSVDDPIPSPLDAEAAEVTVALPSAKAPQDAAASPTETEPRVIRAELERALGTRPSAHREIAAAEATTASPRPVELTPEEEQQLGSSRFADSVAQQLEAAPAAAEPAEAVPVVAVAAAAAKLPLPNATVARTIRRIGYACGGVASATPVEGGAPGVFKVTCTSGDSYQARPVRGRYHFRRWGRN